METAAIARPYAAAAFAIAKAQGTVNHWQETLQAMAMVIAEMSEVIASGQLLTDIQITEIISEALSGKADTHQQKFLSVLADNGRVLVLPEISSHFQFLQRESDGIVSVRVESARPIKDRKSFDEALARWLAATVQTTYEDNADLMGGVCIYVDDDVLDASIRGRLDRLANSLS